MTNSQVVNAFVEVLLNAPELTMQAVALRLSATNYELKLLKADPLGPYEKQWEHQHELDAANNRSFPFMTGEKGVLSIMEVND